MTRKSYIGALCDEFSANSYLCHLFRNHSFLIFINCSQRFENLQCQLDSLSQKYITYVTRISWVTGKVFTPLNGGLGKYAKEGLDKIYQLLVTLCELFGIQKVCLEIMTRHRPRSARYWSENQEVSKILTEGQRLVRPRLHTCQQLKIFSFSTYLPSNATFCSLKNRGAWSTLYNNQSKLKLINEVLRPESRPRHNFRNNSFKNGSRVQYPSYLFSQPSERKDGNIL